MAASDRFDLITGGAVGLIAAGMVHARQLERFELQSVISFPLLDRNLFAGHVDAAPADPGAARVGLVRLKGGFTVASSRQLVDVIGADIKGHDVVIFGFSGTTYLDDSAAKLIGELLDIAREQRTAFVVVGLSDAVAQTLFAFGVLQRVPEGRLVGSMEQARAVARGLLAEDRSGRSVRSGSTGLGRRSGAKTSASSSDNAGTVGSPADLDVLGAKRRLRGRNVRLAPDSRAGERSARIPDADSA